MGIKNRLKSIRDAYVRRQAEGVVLPKFQDSTNVIRVKNVFSGRVQKVGFRQEIRILAERLGITGYAQNLKNGDVLAELQGTEEKIRFLQKYMKSLIRIKIREIREERMDAVKEEKGFRTDL